MRQELSTSAGYGCRISHIPQILLLLVQVIIYAHTMKKIYPTTLAAIALLLVTATASAQTSALTVEKIMQDPKWMGVSPDNVFWDQVDGQVYFDWNPEAEPLNALFTISPKNLIPQRVEDRAVRQRVRSANTDRSGSKLVYTKGGDVYLFDRKSGQESRLTQTAQAESAPVFSQDGKRVIFRQGNNLFAVSQANGSLEQLTNITNASQRGGRQGASEQNKWLQEDQLSLFDVLREKKEADSLRRARSEAQQEAPFAKEIALADDETLVGLEISPDERYVSYRTTKRPQGNQNTIVPNYVTESGYTEDIPARTKVGNNLAQTSVYLYDRVRDTVLAILTDDLPGIKDLPAFWDDYPEEKAKLAEKNADRQVSPGLPYWNESGTEAFVVVTAADNKDRWIMRLNPVDGRLSLIDRQRDEAWIAGPGIGGSWGGGALGWIDDHTFYFQSEATGYSHVYTADIRTGAISQLTSGKYEVSNLQLSNDNKAFYFIGNIDHPGIRHFYRLPVRGGAPEQLTSKVGGHEVSLSPDEKWLAIRYSSSTQPWELYIQENKAGATPKQITASQTEEFGAYDWREPEVISFTNRHGDEIYARLYTPENPKASRPAVIFVHGAGYLQNVHHWWSQYFREYMFHNLLADLGYTVLDIDFTASSGYGRDHRTGIYRHMGGKDLTDQVDGAQLLVEKYGVNPKNIGIYGGSYGGFITLMAMFNESETFAAGAALRSVTDWAHYNHGYTANILNEPVNDPIAYERSSPIYFADGLKGHLLMCHGMVDVNVHFQDIVRMSQRLIELGKDNWELAVYPVEDHGFVYPSSWADEYKRILKLFEERLVN